jgi:hypothetical protein
MISKILAVAALVLLPLSVALWHKSHVNPQQRRYDVTQYKSLRVFLKDGTCGLRLLNMPTKTAARSEFHASLGYDAVPGSRRFLLSSVQRGSYRITWLVFPLWLSTGFLSLFGTVPIILGPARQWWRQWHGLCLECGYSLKYNRSGRCPECGTRYRWSRAVFTSERAP